MPRQLPLVIVDIIEEYCVELHQLESLPEISAVRKLVHRSNLFLANVCTRMLGIPLTLLRDIQLDLDCNDAQRLGPLINIFREDFNTALMFAMQSDYNTSSLFWLFIQRDPNLYFGPYMKLFDNSLFQKFVQVITQA